MIAEEAISPEEVKQTLLRHASRWDEEDFERNWHGTLNEANIFHVARHFRKIFEGKLFAIADYKYVNSDNPDFELSTDNRFNSSWTDKCKDMVRVNLTESPSISFSAGGFFWSWSAAPGNEYDETYRYARITFKDDSVEVKSKAPAGHIHVHIFRVQHGDPDDLAGLR